MTKNDVIKLIEDTLQEFYDCDGGDAAFVFDDETYYTDTGYAIEGIEAFVDRIKRILSDKHGGDAMNDCIFYVYFQDGHATVEDCKLRNDGSTYPTYSPKCNGCSMYTTASEAAELVRQKRGIGVDSSAKQR